MTILSKIKPVIRNIYKKSDVRTLNEMKDILGLSKYHDINFFDKNFGNHGLLRSTAGYTEKEKFDAKMYFEFREKNDCTLTACSSWYGGDYFEFGAVDLATFRNMLSAFSICGLEDPFPDTRFYGFDLFGSLETENEEVKEQLKEGAGTNEYFRYFERGDSLAHHQEMVKEHGLYVDQCHLIKGFFQDTLNDDAFIKAYQKEGRSIGFAFLDCNIGESYKHVFENIFHLMGTHSYIYMDEYLQNPHVIQQFDVFTQKLRELRNLGCVYVRPAGGFGGLFRIYPLAGSKEEKDLCNPKIK